MFSVQSLQSTKNSVGQADSTRLPPKGPTSLSVARVPGCRQKIV
jgi:hypothetical protein